MPGLISLHKVVLYFDNFFQSGYPARIKKIHIYNIGALADVILTVIKFCMTEKIQQRVSIPRYRHRLSRPE